MLFQGMLPWKGESWSHMAMSVESQYFDSRFTGTQSSTESDFLNNYRLIDTITIEVDVAFADFINWFELHRGKDYDTIQLFGLLLKYLNIIKINSIGSGNKKLICSELIIDFLASFKKLKVFDSDDYGLNRTWDILESFNEQI